MSTATALPAEVQLGREKPQGAFALRSRYSLSANSASSWNAGTTLTLPLQTGTPGTFTDVKQGIIQVMAMPLQPRFCFTKRLFLYRPRSRSPTPIRTSIISISDRLAPSSSSMKCVSTRPELQSRKIFGTAKPLIY